MGSVLVGATVSVDGYIAGPDESGFEELFQWYVAGQESIPSANPHVNYRPGEPSKAYLRNLLDSVGSLVVGRRLFDAMDGWQGNHPMGAPLVVMSSRPPDLAVPGAAEATFISDGVEAAIAAARVLANGKDVAVNGGCVGTQALRAGLVDELIVDVAPVILGSGRPLFDSFDTAPMLLGDPEVVAGVRVTHMRYRFASRDELTT